MATPQESITTVNGRRCTRSRARTAATPTILSTEAAQVEAAEVTQAEAPPPTTAVEEQQQTSAAPTPPAPSSAAEPPPSQPAAPAASDTDDPPDTSVAPAAPSVSAQPSTRTAPLANLTPSQPAAAAPNQDVVDSEPEANEPEPTETEAAAENPLPVATARTTTLSRARVSSNSPGASFTPVPSRSSRPSQPSVPLESSVESIPDQPERIPQPNDEPGAPAPTMMSTTDAPPGGMGMIGPEPDGPGEGPGLTISRDTNVGGIVGGVVGGLAIVVLISVLLFLCLRRRRSRDPFAKWQKRVSEKEEGNPGFVGKLQAIPGGLKTVPASLGVFFGKLRKEKAGPAQNPYNRQSARSSVSSVYSVRPNRRSQSMSEPPSRLRQQLRDFGDLMPRLKRSKTLLQRKQDSLVVGDRSPFPGIVEEPVTRNSKGVDNPFADPDPFGPPRATQIADSDLNSEERALRFQQNLDGLRDQQRAPISPKPVASSSRASRDPFISILDELEVLKGNSTPEWLRDTAHKRTQSATTALRSHPPSTYTASVYTTADNPFWDPSDMPPVPQQALPPNPPKRAMNAYTAGLPSFNATSSTSSRGSTGSFFFGEPGPSRPTTNTFSEVSGISAVPRVGRQSDPFDLDRPEVLRLGDGSEVLGYGHVGGRQVRASVTQQPPRAKRTSSVPNWVDMNRQA